MVNRVFVEGNGLLVNIQGAGGIPTPPLPSDLVGWWDGSDTSTFVGMLSDVTAWNDKSGAGNNFNIKVGIGAASYAANQLNGLGVLSFLSVQLQQSNNLLGNSYTLVAVTKNRIVDPNGTTFSQWAPGDPGRTTLLGDRSFDRGGHAVGSSFVTPPGAADSNFHRYIYNKNGSTIDYDRDGQFVTASLAVTAPVVNFVVGGFSGFNTPCDVAEGLLYNKSLSPAEQSQVNAYILAKWGI